MELAQALTEALDRLRISGRVEVRENGEWLAALEEFQYEVRPQGDAVLLHLWSEQSNAIRRVLRSLLKATAGWRWESTLRTQTTRPLRIPLRRWSSTTRAPRS